MKRLLMGNILPREYTIAIKGILSLFIVGTHLCSTCMPGEATLWLRLCSALTPLALSLFLFLWSWSHGSTTVSIGSSRQSWLFLLAWLAEETTLGIAEALSLFLRVSLFAPDRSHRSKYIHDGDALLMAQTVF